MAKFSNENSIADPHAVTEADYTKAYISFCKYTKENPHPILNKTIELYKNEYHSYEAYIRKSHDEYLNKKGMHDLYVLLSVCTKYGSHGRMYYHDPNYPLHSMWFPEKDWKEIEPKLCNIRCPHCGCNFYDVLVFGKNTIQCRCTYNLKSECCKEPIEINVEFEIGEWFYFIQHNHISHEEITGYEYDTGIYDKRYQVWYKFGEYGNPTVHKDCLYKNRKDVEHILRDHAKSILESNNIDYDG